MRIFFVRNINAQALKFQAAGRPVISVDTKKKELIGNYKNAGSDYRPRGHPDQVNVHDFPDAELGKAIPYGVYDIGANVGWVSVGIDHDTGEFAVNTIRRWWQTMGCERYLGTDGVMVTADGGGSNASKARLWTLPSWSHLLTRGGGNTAGLPQRMPQLPKLVRSPRSPAESPRLPRTVVK